MSRSANPDSENRPAAEVAGWRITVRNLNEVVEKAIAAAKAGEAFHVFTLNLDHLVKLRRDAVFRDAYRRARFVTADGAPVARLARRYDPAIERTTGADLMAPMCVAAAEAGLPVYLFGATAATLAEAGADLAERTDGRLAIVGTSAPSAGFDPQGPEADAAIEKIRASGARLCFVALGAPKQELFSARAVEKGVACGFVCIGAAVDFLARRKYRAPKFMQDHGLEWLWRLMTDPYRLAGRYARCAMLLADIEIGEQKRRLVRYFGLSPVGH